jgi:ATP-binding cassette, subfamily B, multidrug efflux pump
MGDTTLVVEFIGRHRKRIALGAMFVVITNMLQALVPAVVGRVVDILQAEPTMAQILWLCGLILLISIVKGCTRFLMRYLIIGASWMIENDIRLRVYDHLLQLPLSYYNRTRTGDIVARLTNDLTAVRMMVGPAVMYTINVLVLMPAVLVFMMMRDPGLALWSVLPFPFIAIIIYFAGRRIHHAFRTVQESYSDISAHVQEDLAGIQVVRSYAREAHELGTLDRLSRAYVRNNQRVIRLQSAFFPSLELLVSVAIVIVLWVGGQKVAAGQTTLGTMVSFIMYLGLLVWPSIALGWVIAVFQRGTASARRIVEILDEEPERRGGEEDDAPPLSGAFEVRDLTFAYDGGTDVLRGISFAVQSGETLAVTGRTGSGKSTLLGVLSGAYDPERGTIFFDGSDAQDIPLNCLRRSITSVPQEAFLFSETIAENIAFGRHDADRDAILQAARIAAIADEIEEFPDGYETVLGERGISVSGGQRQRITIARALISDAPIIFFDDCFANVDTRTEATILTNVKEAVADRTAVIVTQRLGAVADADRILYMKDGCIIEMGTHTELIALDGEYAALYHEQESLESLEDGQ